MLAGLVTALVAGFAAKFAYDAAQKQLRGSPGAKEREAKERRRIKNRVRRMAAVTRKWFAGLHSSDRLGRVIK